MKEADRKKIEKHAAQKMELSICDIYESPAIGSEIEKCYKKFDILPNFFEKKRVDLVFNVLPHSYKTKQAKKDSVILRKLLDQTLKIWSNNYINYQSIDALKRYIHKNFKVSFCKPKYLDKKIWHDIAMARLFGIPKERVLECMHQILVDEYFPKININMQIQINELTTREDILYIWDQVESQQNICKWNPKKKCTNFFTQKKGKFEDPTRERDRMVYELKKNNPKITLPEIINELESRGLKSYNDYNYTYKIIARYKKHLLDIS